MLNIIGFFILIFLPGAWVMFMLRFPGLPFGARLIAGAVLSPLIACLEFYAIRLIGVPFERTVILLVIINLPAFYLIFRQRKEINPPDLKLAGGLAIVLLVLFLATAPQWIYPQVRAYTGHSWYYSAPIYRIANGELLLEDPDLAGVRLAYPWGGLVYQGILSAVMDSPPAAGYIWNNLIWLSFIFILMTYVIDEMGGERISKITSVIWLTLGLNVVGFLLDQVANRTGWNGLYSISGDYRYTPWILKFLFLQQEPFALGMFVAVLFLLMRKWPNGQPASAHLVYLLLLSGIGVIQPILFPAALALIGAKMIALVLRKPSPVIDINLKELFPWGLDILISGGLIVAYVTFITRDRSDATVGLFGPANLTGLKILLLRVVQCGLVILLYLVGWVVSIRSLWRSRREAAMILTLGGAASCLLGILLYIHGFEDQYKYMFTAAICLAPFPSLAIDPLISRSKRKLALTYAALTLLLAMPLAYKVYASWPWIERDDLTVVPPAINLQHFDITLSAGEPYAALVEAIREKTPPGAMILIDRADLYLPALSQRTQYVAPAHQGRYPGVNINMTDMLVKPKGYDQRVIDERRENLRIFFHSEDSSQLSRTLTKFREFNRSVVVVMEASQNQFLQNWLVREKIGSLIYDDGENYALWLIESGDDRGL